MTKKLSIAGLVVAAAASSAIAFGSAPAKAACLPTDGTSSCSTFDPSTASNVVGLTGFAGTASPTTAYDRVRLQFSYTGAWTLPFTLTNVTLAGDGGSFTTPGQTVTVSSTGSFIGGPGGFIAFTIPGTNSIDFANSVVSFTIPSGVVSGTASITPRIVYYTNGDADNNIPSNQPLTATYTDSSATGTPGPLPILGAGAAFGFSRRLRKQIKQVA